MRHPGKKYYDTWAVKELQSESRRFVLKWKAANLANLALRSLKTGHIDSICEIGGGEGIVLNTLGYILDVPYLVNYELSTVFCKYGQEHYPHINYINEEFSSKRSEKYQLILLSDIIEHVENDKHFLEEVSRSCQYCLIKIPIEENLTNHRLYYKLRGQIKPEALIYGPNHENGHLRGYSLPKARNVVSNYFSILDESISDVNFFYGSERSKIIKHRFGTLATIWLFGGALFILAKSKNHP